MRRFGLTLAAVLMLSACGSTDQPDRTTPGAQPSSEPKLVEPPEVEGEIVKLTRVRGVWLAETVVELADGSKLTCLVNFSGGLHCLDPKPQ